MAIVKYVFLLVGIISIVCCDDYHRINVHATFDESSERFQIHDSPPDENTVAWAQYINAVNETGWGMLELGSYRSYHPRYNDSMRAYAAGLVEGYITRDLIRQHWQNTRAGYCDQPLSPYCHRLRDFLQTNLDWIRAAIRNNQDDPYWHQVEMFYTQLKGLSDGYNNDPQLPSLDIDPFGLYMFQISTDLPSLEVALNKPGVKDHMPQGHCSALITVDPEYGDVMVGHNTWTSYTNMLRVLKKYSLPYGFTDSPGAELPRGDVWTFSSYPGYLVSSDDFHLLSSFMVTLETTIPNNNPELYVHTKPEGCLFEPVRVWVANRLANNGAEWVGNFTRYNSGTYNNQWMVVDMKLAGGEGHLPPGLLTIVEQLPGYTEHADVTNVLNEQGYWASYNVAYFPKIFNMSGQQKMVDKYGDFFTHDMCRRAQIFRRDHKKVKDRQTFMNLMRYNDFKNDPLSRCNCTPPYSADLAIAARRDLNSESGTYPFDHLGFRMFGAIDVKMTGSFDLQWLQFDALAGPSNQQQPSFQWSKVKAVDQVPHLGQPDLFDFKPITFNGTVIPPYTPKWYTEH